MKPSYTERQGQFLAYIHQYSILNGCAPAEGDMQRFFRVTPPSVHQMVLTLERRGFIRRVPGKARSITLMVPFDLLPALQRPEDRALEGRLCPMPEFERYIGIDYSGAKTPAASLSGLRVYAANRLLPPQEVLPAPSPRKYWTRRGVAEWLRHELLGGKRIVVGIDHGFSFPLRYFETHGLPPDWPAFLDDFQRHWPTDGDHTYVDFVRDGGCGQGAKRTGDPSWLRLTEQWSAAAKSVFLFDVQGSVAKSTHAGLPWLRYLREHCRGRVHFWPFDGWKIPGDRSVVAEVYPSLWMRRLAVKGLNNDQQAAYAVAAWLRRADMDGSLQRFLNPPLEPQERTLAQVEGWILGVV
jgi:hypothetical protein